MIGYFVENGIMYRSEINWGEVAKDKRFHGMTSRFLSNKLKEMVGNFKRASPGIEVREITIEDLRQYLEERGSNPRVDKSVRGLIEIYENINNSM